MGWSRERAAHCGRGRPRAKTVRSTLTQDRRFHGCACSGCTACSDSTTRQVVVRRVPDLLQNVNPQAAINAGRELASANVTTLEEGFHEETLELLPTEVNEIRECYDGEDDEGEGMFGDEEE